MFVSVFLHFDPILSCPSDVSDSVTNHIETSTIVKLQQQPHSSDVIGQNTKLPLRVKNKKLRIILVWKNIRTEKNRKFKVAKVHDLHVLQDQNYP